uniref:Disease resistance protein RPM1 n=4 Tax=Aegilops tauschii subsp. strangulata TaxID=200361 RepID=A0A453A019_AEGTS
MADFALGLTKTAVEGTLSRVQLAIDEENKLRVTAKQDLRYITGEFQMMQSFLKVANKERANNEVVKTWVRQLRDLAFDVEDCVEFVVHLDNNSALIWLWRLVPSCMAPPRTRELDRAVAELKQLKARVEEVSQRNTRYNLISDSGSHAKTATPTEQLAALATTNPSAFHMLTEVWEAAGRRRGMSDLQKLILGEGSDLQMISVWGSTAADLGTTSIFSMLYSDPDICRAFRRRAWVKFMHPFKPDEFLKSLLTQFYVRSHQENIDVDHLTKAELMQQVKVHKYLIILEEVSGVADWDAIREYLPDNENGSRIIVSTKQLRNALLCTGGGEYQVSELRRFSDDRSLCAFSKKAGRHSGMHDLIWQIRCRGVISLWGISDAKSSLINKVYTSIVYKSKQFDGVEFQRHSWVDVPAPFNLEVFSRRLLVSFRSEDLQTEEIAMVGMMEEPGLTQECCKFLHEDDCLVVINDLQSTHDWDLIKTAFLSEPIKGCILIITNESSVARHCVEEEDGVLNIEDLKAHTMLRPLIKDCQNYGIRWKEATHRGRLFSIRLGETREWFTKFGHMYWEEVRDLWYLLDNPGVISLWGPAGAGLSTLVRILYYKVMLRSDASWEWEYHQEGPVSWEEKITMFSWVDVPHPFNLKDFCWRLLLDFRSDDLRAKKIAAVGIMEGEDPIQQCSKILREDECVVVIDGLRSTDDWDLIKAAVLPDPITSHIIVIANAASVATHCVDKEDRVIKINCLEAGMAIGPPIKGCIFSNRRAEARALVNTFALLGHQNLSADLLRSSLDSSGPSVSSLWGISGVGKSAVVRSLYCHLLLGLDQYFKFGSGHNLTSPRTEFTMCSWVDVRHPFNLIDFSCHWLLDFHSDNLQAKEKAAIGIMEGQDPVQECCRILCEYRSLIVIDGLRSTEDWDLIKASFLPNPTNACIIVITNEASVATHCVDKEDRRVVNVSLEADMALILFKK